MNNSANMVIAIKLMLVSYTMEINNIYALQSLESLAIPYSAKQPVDSQLWDSNFYPISLFEIDEYLEDDAKNIICLLLTHLYRWWLLLGNKN